MNRRRIDSRLTSAVSLYILLLLGYCLPSLGCGLSWGIPQDHFPGVNGRGYVSYFEKVGEVDLGDSLKLPLIINFNSGNERTSPYLGKSFTLFLLESSIVQTGENSFMATFPNGSLNLLVRRNANDVVLQGSAGWKGEIKGDIISMWAPCGWRMDFYKGHIISVTTPKNRKFEYVYSGNMVAEIRENGATVFRVEQGGDGGAKAFLFNGKRVEVTMDQKPNVQCIKGQNVIGSIEQSLKSLSPSIGTSTSFEFAVNEKVQPTLKITNKDQITRLFIWDPASKRVISDNDWTYNFGNVQNTTNALSVARVNKQNQNEYWFKDDASGMETIQGLDGVKTVKTWFVSGPMTGKIRKIEKIAEGKKEVILENIYDEKGRNLYRLLINSRGKVISSCQTFYSGENGWPDEVKAIIQKVSAFVDMKGIAKIKHELAERDRWIMLDKSGKEVAQLNEGEHVEHTLWGENGKDKKTFLDGIVQNAVSYYSNGKMKQKVTWVGNGNNRRQKSETYSYSDEKRETQILIKEDHRESRTVTIQYDNANRVVKQVDSLYGTYTYSYDAAGKKTTKFTN